MTRFGEFGPDSQRHLDHLAGCRSCRDEVGCDRETVRLLRVALAARVEGMEPSSGVWEQVRALAAQPEPRRGRWGWRRASDVMAIGRSLTAMAGTGLALVLALNTQIVTVTLPHSDAASPLAVSDGIGVPSAWDRLPRLVPATSGVALDDAPVMQLDAGPDPEGLVMNVDPGEILATLAAPPAEEPVAEAPTEMLVITRLPLGPEPLPADALHRAGSDDDTEAPEPSPQAAGAPT